MDTADIETVQHGLVISGEEEFIKETLGEIKRYVIQYSKIGGHHHENTNIIEDMIQEAALAVIENYREYNGSGQIKIKNLKLSIWDACLNVISSARTITIPKHWMKEGGETKEGEFLQDRFVCDDLYDVNMFSVPFEENVLDKIIVRNLIENSGQKEQRVYLMIAMGMTPYQIRRHGIDERTVARYLKKARDYITAERQNEEEKRRNRSGRKRKNKTEAA